MRNTTVKYEVTMDPWIITGERGSRSDATGTHGKLRGEFEILIHFVDQGEQWLYRSFIWGYLVSFWPSPCRGTIWKAEGVVILSKFTLLFTHDYINYDPQYYLSKKCFARDITVGNPIRYVHLIRRFTMV